MLAFVSPIVRRSFVVLAAVVVCASLALTARRATDAPATSDTAVIESYTLLASQGHLLVGAYSRFQWHHPGPLYFFLLAPFYALSGDRTAGLNAGAATISLASMAIVALVLMRRRPALAVLGCGVLALFAVRSAEALASPWNPHVTLLPTLALIVVAADVVAGNALALPLVALLATLAGQAHIALLPCVVVLGAIAFLRASAGAVAATGRRVWRWSIILTVVTLLTLWALPLYEQVIGAPRGNITELWHFFINQARGGQPLAVAVSAWSDMMVGVVRPDFYVAHGWPFVESPVRWAEWVSLAELAAVATFAIRAVRRRDWFDAALGGLIVVASSVALWSATRIDGRIFDHDVFWMVGIGVLSLAVTGELVLSVAVSSGLKTRRYVLAATRRYVRSTTRRYVLSDRFAGAVCVVLLAVAGGAVVWQVQEAVRRSYEPSADAQRARAVGADLAAYLDMERVVRPLIKIDQDAWGVAAGAILDLQKHGRPVSVEEDWVVMFTPAFRITGREDAVVTIAMPAEHVRLAERGVPTISAHEPIYAHAARVSAP